MNHLLTVIAVSTGIAVQSQDRKSEGTDQSGSTPPASAAGESTPEKQADTGNVEGPDKELRGKIRTEAQKCADLLIKGEFAAFAETIPPRVLKIIGGKEKVVQMLTEGTEKMKETAGGLESATIGLPEELIRGEGLRACLVPQTIVMKVGGPRGTLTTHSWLLAVSEDDGKTWTFADMQGITEKTLPEIFPELVGKFKFPKKTKPEFKAAE